MRHPTSRQLSGALLGVLAVTSLPGCQRRDIAAEGAPSGAPSIAYLEDSALTARVRAALILSPVVDSFNIGVESHGGVVLLSGRAADPTQIDLAVFVAQNVPDVMGVDSFMFSAGAAPEQTAQTAHPFEAGMPTTWSPQAGGVRSAPEGPGQPASTAAAPLVSLSHPLGFESAPPAGNTPRQSWWVSLAHNVLGIRSIQDELLIKQ